MFFLLFHFPTSVILRSRERVEHVGWAPFLPSWRGEGNGWVNRFFVDLSKSVKEIQPTGRLLECGEKCESSRWKVGSLWILFPCQKIVWIFPIFRKLWNVHVSRKINIVRMCYSYSLNSPINHSSTFFPIFIPSKFNFYQHYCILRTHCFPGNE